MMRKFILIVILSQFVFRLYASSDPIGFLSNIDAKSFILIDSKTNRVLVSYHATEKLNPASITKLMTAYVVYKAIDKGVINLHDKVTISRKARSITEGSRMFLERGSKVSIDDLLHGLIIQSGNDAAVALAEAVAGSVEKFIPIMNAYAKKLGMNNTYFKNVIGFTEKEHYMSAQDIAILANAIISEYPEHYKIYKQKTFTWNDITQKNRNTLLNTDPSVDGLKTGHTDAAGYSLVVSAKRNGMRLISVVLGTNSKKARAVASRKILDFGFANYLEKTLLKSGEKIASKPIKYGVLKYVGIAAKNTVTIPVLKKIKIKMQLVLDKNIEAPVTKGQVIGKIVIKQNGVIISSSPAIIMSNIEKVGILKQIWRDIFN